MYRVIIHLIGGYRIIHNRLSSEDMIVFKQLFQTAKHEEWEWISYTNKNGSLTDIQRKNITHIQWPKS